MRYIIARARFIEKKHAPVNSSKPALENPRTLASKSGSRSQNAALKVQQSFSKTLRIPCHNAWTGVSTKGCYSQLIKHRTHQCRNATSND